MAFKITATIIARKDEAADLNIYPHDAATQGVADQVRSHLVGRLAADLNKIGADLVVTVEDVKRDGTSKDGQVFTANVYTPVNW